jgi:hypothetical protein
LKDNGEYPRHRWEFPGGEIERREEETGMQRMKRIGEREGRDEWDFYCIQQKSHSP